METHRDKSLDGTLTPELFESLGPESPKCKPFQGLVTDLAKVDRDRGYFLAPECFPRTLGCVKSFDWNVGRHLLTGEHELEALYIERQQPTWLSEAKRIATKDAPDRIQGLSHQLRNKTEQVFLPENLVGLREEVVNQGQDILAVTGYCMALLRFFCRSEPPNDVIEPFHFDEPILRIISTYNFPTLFTSYDNIDWKRQKEITHEIARAVESKDRERQATLTSDWSYLIDPRLVGQFRPFTKILSLGAGAQEHYGRKPFPHAPNNFMLLPYAEPYIHIIAEAEGLDPLDY